MQVKRLIPAGAALLFAATLSNCVAFPVLGGLTLNELSSGTSFISTGLTGKSLGEHGLDLATGKDCRLIEAAFRDDRKVCEERGSVATARDFKGLLGS